MGQPLSQADQELLDAACLAYEEAAAASRTVKLEELLPPGRQELLPQLRREVDLLKRFLRPADLDAVTEPLLPREKFAGQRYQPVRFHAEGGLGRVFLAQDAEVQREVALKVPKPGKTQPAHLELFLREAEITGRLEHPGVVPLYSLGTDADGQPYYTMRFIRGESLADAVAAFHQKYPRPVRTTDYNRAFRALLQRLISVCQTVAYAHNRGVVHRDLKPGNVMAGKYGETLVVDWGLAKIIGRDDKSRTEAEQTLPPTTPSESDLTRTGTAKGTPAFMSPEQANGQWDKVGPASDIFSLGATLYALLTGRPPYQGPTALFDARLGKFLPPRQVRPGLPAALEAICLKAMAVLPGARYDTASALARDLELWLADEPVSAYCEPWTGRARRWARKHRPIVAGVTAAALVGLAALGAGLVGYEQEQARQEEKMTAALDEAEQTHRALNQQLTDPKKAQVLLDHFDRWESQLDRAKAAWRLARNLADAPPPPVAQRLTGLDDALGADDRHLAIAKELDGIRLKAASSVEGKFDYAAADRDYARAFQKAGMATKGKEPVVDPARVRDSPIAGQLLAALDDWARVTRDRDRRKRLLTVARLVDPDKLRNQLRDPKLWENPPALKLLADKANVRDLSRPLVVAVGAWLSGRQGLGVPLLTKAWRQYPDDFWIAFMLGHAFREAGKPEAAAGFYRAALALRPKTAAVWNDLGLAMANMNRPDEASGYYHKALEIDSKYASAYINLGNHLKGKGRTVEAIKNYKRALQIDPNNAIAHSNIGNTRREQNLLHKALWHCQKAVELDPEYALAHNNLGLVLQDMGQLNKAILQYEKAVKIDLDFAKAHNNLGNALADKAEKDKANGKVDSAKRGLEEAIKHYKMALKIDPKIPQVYVNLAATFVANLTLIDNRDNRLMDDAIRYCRQAIAINPKFASAHTILGYALIEKKKYAAATRAFGKSLAINSKLAQNPANSIRSTASCCAALAGCGKGEDAACLDKKVRARLRQQARDWLTADLTIWSKKADGDAKARAQVRQMLQRWLKEPALAGIHDLKELALLPKMEQEACRKLWKEVSDVIQKAASKR